MEFKHAISLLFSHPQYVIKIFLYLLICVVIVAAVGCAIIIPVFNNAMTYADISDTVNPIFQKIHEYLRGDVGLRAIITQVVNSFEMYWKAVVHHPAGIVATILIPIGLYFLYSFLSGLCLYPLGYIINNLMSSNMKMPLGSSFVINLKKSAKYSATKMLILFPIDIIFAVLMIVLIWGLKQVIGIFVMPIILIIALIWLSFRQLLTAGWMPRMIYHPEEKPFVAFKKSMPYLKMDSRGMLQGFIFTFVITYALNSALALPTYGIIFIIVPSFYYFIFRAIEFICYYKVKGLKFYTDASTVIDPTEYGYRKETQEQIEEEPQSEEVVEEEKNEQE